MTRKMKYPEGHFIGTGLAIGIAISSGVGIPLSISTGNPGLIGLGPGIGLLLGLAIGKVLEEKHKKQGLIRPLTDKEMQTRKNAKIIGIISVIIGIIALASIILIK